MKDADITPQLTEGRHLVEAYGPGRFTVGGRQHEGSIQLTAGEVAAWPAARVEEITLESLAFVLEQDPPYEVLLIGTGEKMHFLSPVLRRAIREKGPVPEFMDTGAAARTFNLLQTENRRVAAALLAV
jgi:uncharacterized protein